MCGSLAAVATPQAGEMSVTGGATATFAKGNYTTNGNPIGMNTGLTFTGSGELDGGTTFTLTITHADNCKFRPANESLNNILRNLMVQEQYFLNLP